MKSLAAARRLVLPLVLALGWSTALHGQALRRGWTVSAFTGFPDVVGVSWTVPAGAFDVRPAVAAIIPGVALRVGFPVDILETWARRVDLSPVVGARAAYLYAAGPLVGPTIELEIRSWPLIDDELFMTLTAGAWHVTSWRLEDVDVGGLETEQGWLPIVRFALGRARE